MVIKFQKFYKPLLVTVSLLCVLGLFVLFSAALGKLASTENFYKIIIVQIVGIILGAVFIYISITNKKVDYRLLYKKRYSLYLFVSAILFQLLVFTSIGVERKGAQRWIDAGITTIQPSEFLKIALVLFLASLLVGFKKEIKKFKSLVIVLSVSAGISGLLMLLIRDKGTLIIMGIAILAMLFVSRVKKIHILYCIIITTVALGGLISFSGGEQYAKDRILSFLGIIDAPLGQNYQVNQAVATIGSGQLFGKGYGQSVQKHSFLPETLNDSIFAIFAEEWGFVGCLVLVILFLILLWQGLDIARKSHDEYGRYVAVGLVTLITAQAFFNILAMVKLVPLSGMPLIFISKGGSAMVASLVMVAILLNISRFTKK